MLATNNKQDDRLEASRRFWQEIAKTRGIDPDTGEPESLRSWARRLGIDINNLVQWQRGGSITPRMIRKVTDKLNMPQSEFFRLFSIAEPAAPEFTPTRVVPLYDAERTRGIDGHIDGDKIGGAPIMPELLRDANVSRDIAAIKISDSCDDSSPIVPPGSIVFIDVAVSRDTITHGALYAVNDEYEEKILLRTLKEARGVLYTDPINKKIKGERSWTANLRKLIVGVVFLVQAPIRRVVV